MKYIGGFVADVLCEMVFFTKFEKKNKLLYKYLFNSSIRGH